MNALLKAAPFFVLFMLLSPTLALAQVQCDSNCQYVWNGIFGFQVSWLNEPRELIVNAILPSIAIYAIFLGIFRAIKLNQFMGGMEHVISIVVTLSALFTGGVSWVNTFMLAFLGQFAFFAFFFMFIIGVGFYFLGYYRKSKGESALTGAFLQQTQNLNLSIKKERVLIQKLRNDMAKATDADKRDKLLKEIMKHEGALNGLERKRNELGRSYAAVPP